MGEIGLEQTFDPRWCVLRFHLAQNLAANRARGAKAASGHNVIAVHRIAFLIDANARRDKPDVADIMLSTGMVAAGEMDIDRLIEFYARLTPLSDVFGVSLCVSGRKPAAARPGTGDEPGPDRRCTPVEAGLFYRRLGIIETCFGDP